MAVQQVCDDDMTLLQRMEKRDECAIALFYDRHARCIYSIALRVLNDMAASETITSDILMEVWQDPRRFMGIRGTFSAALAILARNRAVARLQKADPKDELSFPRSEYAERPTFTREEACVAVDAMAMDRRIMLERAFFGGINHAGDSGSSKPTERQEKDGVMAALADSGLEVIDLQTDLRFSRRQLHARDVVSLIEGLNRLALALVERPENILQELVNASVDLCGADSAGISVEQEHGTDDDYYHWVATAGQYSGFVNAKLPRYPSACGVTLERGRPQIFRVKKQFFDLMRVQAPAVTDGILLPWNVEGTRGTIWIMAHGRDEAFDVDDCRIMLALASFSATGVRLQQRQSLLLDQAKTLAAASMANKLAHEINNPLQGLMQTMFLLDRAGEESNPFAKQAMGDVARLSNLVMQLLSTPRYT